MCLRIIITHLTPIREHSEYLMKNKDILDSALKVGEDAARKIAAETMNQVSSLVGLNWYQYDKFVY